MAQSNPPQADPPRTILINSVLAAVLGAGLMVLVHELVHLVTGLFLGHAGELYPFGVQHVGDASIADQATMLLSAPIFSLVTGLALAFWQPLRARGGLGHLVWLWFAFTSIMEGVGYLIITPFGAGDTGWAAALLGWPTAVTIALCIVGVGLQFFTAWLFAPHVGRHAGAGRENKAGQMAFAFWPWLIGSVVNIGLAIIYLNLARADFGEGAALAIIAASTAQLVFAPMAFIFNKRFNQPFEPLGLKPVPWIGVALVVLLIAVNLGLTMGLKIG